MKFKKLGLFVAISAMVGLLGTGAAHAQKAENITMRIASGHPVVNTYVNLLNTFFVPEVTKRVKERTPHTINFIEGYGGAMVKLPDTLEGVQSGIIDLGAFCFCFEPSNLPLHAFQVMLPFGTMDAEMSLKVARAVYNRVPYLSNVFEEKWNQKLLGIIADNGYNLGTTMPWKSVSDLKGVKLAGAGLNLKWLEYVGAIPVQGTLNEAYQGMQTGVYNGWIMFPSAWVNFKLYEQGKYYTEIGFGSITWHGLTINKRRWDALPKDVQAIIAEVAREYELRTGKVNQENYPKQIAQLKELGTQITAVPPSVRLEWANSLAGWPQEMASSLDKQGLPASQVLKATLEEAEKAGHKWPVRYKIQ
ncbi:MAG: hypothetical protein FJY35_02555 [Betaproteobacteria bacterium]|nr:hypothetical protein [Betaproteobacteria bacterium]